MAKIIPRGEAFETDGVSGYLHRPDSAVETAIVLGHGAGSNADAPQIIQSAAAFCDAGVLALRIHLPFRLANKPPHPSRAGLDRDGLRRAVAAVRELGAKRVILGGHSYGGRQASMLLAEDPSVAEASLLLSYPLHPPDKPQQLRTDHFPALRTPALFVHGTKDPFGTIGELREALTLLPVAARLIEVPGAGHDLRKLPLVEIVPAALSLLQ
ncbi:MAG: dienelactone hydrolase family protein [Acidobacteria bacterium]|nr:dienelactone hydrolase family protein [Acidobacteriota bacterium]